MTRRWTFYGVFGAVYVVHAQTGLKQRLLHPRFYTRLAPSLCSNEHTVVETLSDDRQVTSVTHARCQCRDPMSKARPPTETSLTHAPRGDSVKKRENAIREFSRTETNSTLRTIVAEYRTHQPFNANVRRKKKPHTRMQFKTYGH